MGIRQRTIHQTITEYVCDPCKNPVDDNQARVGTLAVKSPKARGKAPQLNVAFHTACLNKLSNITGRSNGTPKQAKRTAAKVARKATRSKKTAKRS